MQRGSGDSLLWEGATPASILVDMMNMACHRKGSLGWAWMQDNQNLALADPPHPLQISTCRSKYVRALCLQALLPAAMTALSVQLSGMHQAPAVLKVVLCVQGCSPLLSLSTSSMVSMSSTLAPLSRRASRLEAVCLASPGDELALGPPEAAALTPVSSSSLIRSGRESESSSRDACLAAAAPLGAPAGTSTSELPVLHSIPAGHLCEVED